MFRARGELLLNDDFLTCGSKLRDVMIIGRSQHGFQRNNVRFRDDVGLRTRLAAIGWVWASVFAAPSARSEEYKPRTSFCHAVLL